DKWMVRQIFHTASEVLRDAYEQTEPADQMLESAEQKFFDIGRAAAAVEVYPMASVVSQVLDRIDERTRPNQATRVKTGFFELDRKLGGFRNGELTIIGARTSVGKTALALSMAHRVTLTGAPVLVVSLEQGRVELAERMLCALAEVDTIRLQTGNLGEGEFKRLTDAEGRLRET